MKQWDAFISYASEDRSAVAVPLANKLQAGGITVWLDTLRLRWGDSLSKKIARGLSNSRFGIVIISKSFLAKKWPRKELDALLQLENDGQNVIIPIVHGIDDLDALEAMYPTLADRVFGNTSVGIDELADQVMRTILHP